MQREAQATAMATGSIVLGTVCCVSGAMLAAALTWHYKGRPNREGAISHLQQRMPERMRSIDEGVVGQSVRALGSTAQVAIPEHEGLQNLAAGLKTQFNPEVRRR